MSLRALIYVLSALALWAPAMVRAATFTVDTTSDSVALTACTAAPGDCSLRGAINRANADAVTDTIAFNIPLTAENRCNASTGVCRIVADTDLVVGCPVTIDGYTQLTRNPPGDRMRPVARCAQLLHEGLLTDSPACAVAQLDGGDIAAVGRAAHHPQGVAGRRGRAARRVDPQRQAAYRTQPYRDQAEHAALLGLGSRLLGGQRQQHQRQLGIGGGSAGAKHQSAQRDCHPA